MEIKTERYLVVALPESLQKLMTPNNPELILSEELLEDLKEFTDTLRYYFEEDYCNRKVKITSQVYRGLDEILTNSEL